MSEPRDTIADFGKAVLRLREALAQPKTEFLRDACIQRFEFAFELAWKSVQKMGRNMGVDCPSPRSAFAFALRNGWITEESEFLEMLETRNRTVHTYDDGLAEAVYSELPRFAELLGRLQAECGRVASEPG